MVRIKVFSWVVDGTKTSVIVKGFDAEEEMKEEALKDAFKYLSKQKGQRVIAVGDKEIQRAFELVGAERSQNGDGSVT